MRVRIVSVDPAFRKLTIIAKDPGLRIGGKNGPMAFAQVDVAAEKLAKGPTGYRIKVVDYNATDRVAYRDEQNYQSATGELIDPFAPREGETLLDPVFQARLIGDPNFHAQNVYAIAMRTLARFEAVLARRIGWSFASGHQLNIVPHAFAQANAFYSEPDRTLMFGYFRNADGEPIFTALSHDIIVHETTHAVLDGLRSQLSEPSGPDQAAFHEGFADIVALLSVFAMESVVAAAIGEDASFARDDRRISLVDPAKLEPGAIKASILLGLAGQVGAAMEDGRRDALRRSIQLDPSQIDLASNDEHDRGELIVAAVMNAFLDLWLRRIAEFGSFDGRYNLSAVVAEGASVAEQILKMCIRALDYCPTTDLEFSQYLAALLTADRELVPDDGRFGYRSSIRDSFAKYGITTPPECDVDGCWPRFVVPDGISRDRSNFVAMTRYRDELFRFIWENRELLGLSARADTQVLGIDAVTRAGPDGIQLTETICQYSQRVDLFGAEIEWILGTKRPPGIATSTRLTAFGGGVLVLDQFGQLKYHIANPLDGGSRQAKRLEYLVETGGLDARGSGERMRFALYHLDRMGA